MRFPVHACTVPRKNRRGGQSVSTRRLVLAVLCAAGVLAFSVPAALAGQTHFFQSSFNASDAPAGARAPFGFPFGVAVDNSTSLMDLSVGDVYVADVSNSVVDKFDSSGGYLSQIEVASALEVAVDQSNGDLYVSNGEGNGVVDKFDPSGNVVASFGQGGQLDGGATPQGAFRPYGVAVDPATGELFVADHENNVIDVFSSAGVYQRQFPSISEPGDIAIDSAGDVFVTSVGVGTAVYKVSGSLDTAYGGGTGMLETGGEPLSVTVDPTDNDVYVTDYESGQVVQYNSAGGQLSLFGSEQLSRPRGVGVDAATGDVYAVSGGGQDVDIYGPLVTLADVSTEAATGVGKATATLHGSVNPEEVAVSECKFEYRSEAEASFTHTAACEPAPGSGDAPVPVSATVALQPGTTYRYRLAATNTNGTSRSQEETLRTEVAVEAVRTGAAEDVTGRTAKLTGSLAPDGTDVHYYFQYGTEAGVYGSTSPAPPGTDAGSAEESIAAHTELSGLEPNTTYHYRLIAENAFGAAYGEDESFTTNAYPAIAGEWVSNVASSSATLQAQLDPGNADTTYHFEYGATSGYGASVPAPDRDAGSGRGEVLAGVHVQGLAPGTAYHYRVVATNEVGTVDGADHVFTTESAGGEPALPDGRVWELVSPPNKNGALIEFHESRQTELQASEDGGAIAYMTNAPVGSGAVGNQLETQVLSTRGATGWSSQDIDPPNEKPTSIGGGYDTAPYQLFSSDLSSAVVEPADVEPALSPEASKTEKTLYLRDNLDGGYRPLVYSANVPPNTKFNAPAHELAFLDATPDLSHIILSSPEALTDNAIQVQLSAGAADNHSVNLYEWSGGKLQLVNVLPNGEATVGEAYLGRNNAMVAHSVSSDGRFVVWTHKGTRFRPDEEHTLYLRDMVKGETIQLGGSDALFQTASSDGSKVFFTETSNGLVGDLMEYDTKTGVQTDLTVDGNPGESADVLPGVMGASEDGSYVYVVANGVLGEGAREGATPGDCVPESSAGTCNLYVLHETGGVWKTTFIATLSGDDQRSWEGDEGSGYWYINEVSSRVSPDGRYVAFMSERSLTGFDNTDAVSGRPDEEVYLYDASLGRLACVSCSPTGERPVGVLDEYEDSTVEYVDHVPFVDHERAWDADLGTGTHWLAGSLPGWAPSVAVSGLYQPRYLSDSGRLFFDSPEALVPQDINGLEDVYEYEPAGVGSCMSSGVTFNTGLGGCVSLISSGTSSEESAFFDASTNGDDVFFLTTSQLVPEALDISYNLYDAHVCSSSSPCVVAPVLPPACDSGDSCRPAPSLQPAVFGAPASATFSGAGNLASSVSKPVVKAKKPKKPKKARAKRRKGRAKRKRSAKGAGSVVRTGVGKSLSAGARGDRGGK